MIKHIWFDMAGTLYRETPEFEAAHDALRYRTYATLTHEEDFAKAKDAYEALYEKYGSNSAVFTSLGKPSDYWQEAFDEMDINTLLKPDEEVIQTLTQLRSKVPVSLFTNFKRSKIFTTLDLLSIPADIFTHILSGDEITERKPTLEGFEKMIALSGLPANEILYVGDREKVDIVPAKRVGMSTCLLWGSSSCADYNLQSFGRIITVL